MAKNRQHDDEDNGVEELPEYLRDSAKKAGVLKDDEESGADPESAATSTTAPASVARGFKVTPNRRKALWSHIVDALTNMASSGQKVYRKDFVDTCVSFFKEGADDNGNRVFDAEIVSGMSDEMLQEKGLSEYKTFEKARRKQDPEWALPLTEDEVKIEAEKKREAKRVREEKLAKQRAELSEAVSGIKGW